MSAALKIGGEENIYHFFRNACARNASAHTEDVSVIVKTGVFCGVSVCAECCTDTLYLVCGDRDADARSADKDSLLYCTVGDLCTDLTGNERIITARSVHTAKLYVRNTEVVKVLYDLFFQRIACVIAADSDLFFSDIHNDNCRPKRTALPPRKLLFIVYHNSIIKSSLSENIFSLLYFVNNMLK